MFMEAVKFGFIDNGFIVLGAITGLKGYRLIQSNLPKPLNSPTLSAVIGASLANALSNLVAGLFAGGWEMSTGMLLGSLIPLPFIFIPQITEIIRQRNDI